MTILTQSLARGDYVARTHAARRRGWSRILCGVIGGAWKALALCLLAAAAPAQERRIEVEVKDGAVSLRALARATLDAYGLPEELARFRDVDLPVRGVTGAALLFGMRSALGKAADVDLTQDGTQLAIVIDRKQSRRLRRKAKDRVLALFSRLSGEDLAARRYRLELPERVPADAPLVVLVHGLDARSASVEDLRAWLEKAGFATAMFSYPNDEAIDASGAKLARHLAELAREHPKTRVFLVAHSMGGLVARWALETPGLDPGNVDRLIMLGTPNHGSHLARARFALELAGYLRNRDVDPHVLQTLRDGLGEAGHDLCPGSVLLQELNALPRNARVTYRLVLGTGAPISEKLHAWLTREAGRAELLGPWLEQLASNLDEVIAGKGDGAVAVQRGKLAGVETKLVPLDHAALASWRGLLRSRVGDKHPAFEAVGAWLR